MQENAVTGSRAQEPGPTNAGVHVYRRRLEACVGGRHWIVPNEPTGWLSVTEAFKASAVRLVAVDVIGGFERGLTQALQGMGFAVVRVGTRQALAFARSRDASNKTGRVDAVVLRDFADALISFGSDFELYLPPNSAPVASRVKTSLTGHIEAPSR